ncbi:MAG: cobalamin biosynthesis protein CbiX [Rhodobacteraceae bacterium]|jgi:sirohydrochlorin ferrochelatase|nr:cobalamin biosynthesis protein CbiX [Paracoccaceae bacterium]
MTVAVIVAHGQPSDPLPAAAELAALAGKVAALLPGLQVGAATLAEPEALARAVAGKPSGLILPLFMAAGWFTRSAIPARLAEAGAAGWQVMQPFGLASEVGALAVALARESGGGEVLLAAHGSFKSAEPARVARGVAARIAAEAGIPCSAAFIDQSPRLSEATGFGRAAICLPFFAMAGGHVTTDLPAALAEAGFPGRILPALGTDPRVPGLIAGLLRDILPAAPGIGKDF